MNNVALKGYRCQNTETGSCFIVLQGSRTAARPHILLAVSLLFWTDYVRLDRVGLEEIGNTRGWPGGQGLRIRDLLPPGSQVRNLLGTTNSCEASPYCPLHRCQLGPQRVDGGIGPLR